MREADGDLRGVVGLKEVVALAVIAPVPRRELRVLGKLGRQEPGQTVAPRSSLPPGFFDGRRVRVLVVAVAVPEAAEPPVLLLASVAHPGHEEVHPAHPCQEDPEDGHDPSLGEDALESVDADEDAEVDAEDAHKTHVGPQLALHVLLGGGPDVQLFRVVAADAGPAPGPHGGGGLLSAALAE